MDLGLGQSRPLMSKVARMAKDVVKKLTVAIESST
jgi:hypothetical protein